MAEFMTANEYIDSSIQKAFLKGINIQVLQEVIQDAKAKKKSLHISWYDLTDAYGSISHDLITHCMKHFHMPEREIKYIESLYSKLNGKVMTKNWESERFRFCNGIFLGDIYSPIVFNVVFHQPRPHHSLHETLPRA